MSDPPVAGRDHDDPDDDPDGDLADDVVVYDLSDWDPGQRSTLDRLLTGEGVAYHWDHDEAPASWMTPDAVSGPTSPPAMAGQLLVGVAHADLVEELIDEVDHPDALDVDDADDDGGGEVLSDLYVASDVLLGAPGSVTAIEDAQVAAAAASSSTAPYGLDDATWAEVRRRAGTLAEALAAGDEERVVPAARALREAVRPLV